MSLMHIAWINALSALGITGVVIANVEALGGSRSSHVVLPVVWLIALGAFVGLYVADRRNQQPVAEER
jgi:hypothetical protein